MTDSHLVSTEWLADRLGKSNLLPIDGSWYLPTENRNSYKEFLEKHIPSAVFFDIDAISDRDSSLPHMLPSADDFSHSMSKLGISDGQELVIYDSAGMFSSPRVWWTFRTMGVENVKVLNGGLPKWISEGRPLERGENSRPASQFTANLNKGMVIDKQQIVTKLESGDFQIADARPEARFSAELPEPRPVLRQGHIPSSINLPFSKIVDGNGCLKSKNELESAFKESGLNMAKPIVTSCGSGVAAAILTLAMSELGKEDTKLYDGSWAEWGDQEELPVETGCKK